MSDGKAKNHIVRDGECLSSIAVNEGFLWETIWNHPSNSELKNLRKDPNILYPGDVVVIPAREPKELSRASDAAYSFVKKGTPAKVRLQLLQEGEPRASVSFIFDVDGKTTKGKTDSEGYLTVFVAPNASHGKLYILDQEKVAEEYAIKLGHLDPLHEIEGIQKRLSNLGFHCPLSEKLDEPTKAAISAFRAKHKLKNGEIDSEFSKKLKTIHGS